MLNHVNTSQNYQGDAIPTFAVCVYPTVNTGTIWFALQFPILE